MRKPRAQRVLTAALPCLPGHPCTGQPAMASDPQTQVGKPQPFNPKVGTTQRGCSGDKQGSFTRLSFPSVQWGWHLPLWASLSLSLSLPGPQCPLLAHSLAHDQHARIPSTSFQLWRLKFLCLTMPPPHPMVCGGFPGLGGLSTPYKKGFVKG